MISDARERGRGPWPYVALSVLLGGAVLLAAVVTTANVIRVLIFSRQREIDTMRLVSANTGGGRVNLAMTWSRVPNMSTTPSFKHSM